MPSGVAVALVSLAVGLALVSLGAGGWSPGSGPSLHRAVQREVSAALSMVLHRASTEPQQAVPARRPALAFGEVGAGVVVPQRCPVVRGLRAALTDLPPPLA